MVYKSFDKKTASSRTNMNANNKKLAEELYKSVIRKQEQFIQNSKIIFGVLI